MYMKGKQEETRRLKFLNKFLTKSNVLKDFVKSTKTGYPYTWQTNVRF